MRASHWLLLAAALALGIAGGALWPPPPPPELEPQTGEWNLPEPTSLTRHVNQDLIEVHRLLHWDGARAAEQDNEQDKAVWRLAGIVRAPDSAVLIITQEQPGEAQRFVVGDVLPDGSVLIAVNRDSIQNQRGACTRTWQLFSAQPVEQSEGCHGDIDPATEHDTNQDTQ